MFFIYKKLFLISLLDHLIRYSEYLTCIDLILHNLFLLFVEQTANVEIRLHKLIDKALSYTICRVIASFLLYIHTPLTNKSRLFLGAHTNIFLFLLLLRQTYTKKSSLSSIRNLVYIIMELRSDSMKKEMIILYEGSPYIREIAWMKWMERGFHVQKLFSDSTESLEYIKNNKIYLIAIGIFDEKEEINYIKEVKKIITTIDVVVMKNEENPTLSKKYQDLGINHVVSTY